MPELSWPTLVAIVLVAILLALAAPALVGLLVALGLLVLVASGGTRKGR